ncbi:uncharacterized protein FFNC_15386 [Fusarium fujikuroi]|nr:uncharacterized protein FFNC_15386 [Fusarium fujikuroi]
MIAVFAIRASRTGKVRMLGLEARREDDQEDQPRMSLSFRNTHTIPEGKYNATRSGSKIDTSASRDPPSGQSISRHGT